MAMKVLGRDQALRFREYFASVDYTIERLQGKMGLAEIPSRMLRTLPYMLDQTREPTPLHVLARWFFVGVPVQSQLAAGLIPDWLLNLLLESGLLAEADGSLAPMVRITPVDKMVLISDSALDADGEKRSDLVLWPNPTTRLLSRFAIRRPSRLTLDLGTGCGLHAFEAAAHSERVVGTDLNPRAIEFARFNARLNGFENAEFLTGDMFEPVRGRKFDLILANPPFFITPSQQHMYCDNNLELDGFCSRLAREAPEHLNENGYFQMLCEWAQVEGESWKDRVAGWLRGSGCDAWVRKVTSAEVARYAQDHFKLSVPYSGADSEAFAEWIAYYRVRKVEAVHGGMIAMRRRTGTNWIRLEDSQNRPGQPFGDAVALVFANRDFLEASASDEQLLAARLKLSPDAELEQHCRQGKAGWEQTSLTLRLNRGLLNAQSLQPLVAEFVGKLDGSRTLGETIDEWAAKTSASPEQARRECLAIAARLMERELLTCCEDRESTS